MAPLGTTAESTAWEALVKSTELPPPCGFYKKPTRDEGAQAVTGSAETNPTKH